MAKNNTAVSENEPKVIDVPASNVKPLIEGAMLEPPKDGVKVESRSSGFWDENANVPFYGRLMFAREVEITKGPSKGKKKMYIVAELAATTMLAANREKNQPARAAQKGEVVSLWITPGLDDLKRLGGVTVWVQKNPASEFIDTGKGNPMKTYKIVATKGAKGEKVEVIPFGDDEPKPAYDNSAEPF